MRYQHALAGLDSAVLRTRHAKPGLPFVVVLDADTAVAATYRVTGLPTHFFIDADGVLRDWKIGPMGNKEIERKLQAIIPLSRAP